MRVAILTTALAALIIGAGQLPAQAETSMPILLAKVANSGGAASSSAAAATNVSNAISDACKTSCDDVSGTLCDATTTSYCTSCEHTSSTASGRTKKGRAYGPGFNVKCEDYN